jgi:hypothetical protein
MDPNQTENLTKLIIDFISPKAIEVKKDLQGLNRFILISC